ncbi:MAG: hypothetical protein EOM20_21500 [Spartobacteria bacterium]|nr:hypothetical protein [Spartobacteria bacterium]
MNLQRIAFLINAIDNPDAEIDDSTFEDQWTWLKAPADWTPDQGFPPEAATIDAVIVFSRKYEEKEIRRQCHDIWEKLTKDIVPLLVAISQYEMPLANRIKELPNAHFIFIPIREHELTERLHVLPDSTLYSKNHTTS